MTKGLKALKKAFGKYDHRIEYEIIKNELKILEIIIKKLVDIGWLNYFTKDVNDYNQFMLNQKYMLTKKEYNLLKEIMKIRALR